MLGRNWFLPVFPFRECQDYRPMCPPDGFHHHPLLFPLNAPPCDPATPTPDEFIHPPDRPRIALTQHAARALVEAARVCIRIVSGDFPCKLRLCAWCTRPGIRLAVRPFVTRVRMRYINQSSKIGPLGPLHAPQLPPSTRIVHRRVRVICTNHYPRITSTQCPPQTQTSRRTFARMRS